MTSHVSQNLKRILIADDDVVIRHLITSIVRKEGYDAITADDGREAYRIIKSDANFCAAIFDMTMPHLEGLDLIGYMKTEKRLMRIPVMMITADQSLELMARSFLAGVTVFLPKPFSAEKLQATLQILLNSKRTAPRVARNN
jgi:DNA-binding response OmpR family regulator